MAPETLFHLGTVLLAQQGAAGGAPVGGASNPFALMPLIIGIGMLFYFMVLRPETQRRKDQEKMHSELKKNDRIVTIGGIHGTVVNVAPDSDEVTIKVDESTNTRIRVLRTAVQTVVNTKDSSQAAK